MISQWPSLKMSHWWGLLVQSRVHSLSLESGGPPAPPCNAPDKPLSEALCTLSALCDMALLERGLCLLVSMTTGITN